MLSVGYCVSVVNSINQYLLVFSIICWYLPVNITGMENTDIAGIMPALEKGKISGTKCSYLIWW